MPLTTSSWPVLESKNLYAWISIGDRKEGEKGEEEDEVARIVGTCCDIRTSTTDANKEWYIKGIMVGWLRVQEVVFVAVLIQQIKERMLLWEVQYGDYTNKLLHKCVFLTILFTVLCNIIRVGACSFSRRARSVVVNNTRTRKDVVWSRIFLSHTILSEE